MVEVQTLWNADIGPYGYLGILCRIPSSTVDSSVRNIVTALPPDCMADCYCRGAAVTTVRYRHGEFVSRLATFDDARSLPPLHTKFQGEGRDQSCVHISGLVHDTAAATFH